MDAGAFWATVDSSGGPDACWPWTGGRFTDGYGCLAFEGRTRRAHRVAYLLAVGPIPEGLFCCHRCDAPLCCNPRHLFLGTNADNLADMARKGRSTYGDRHYSRRLPERLARGERHGQAKFTDEQVRAIRADPRSCRVLAKVYGVSHAAIGHVRTGRRWGHVG